MPYHFEFDSKNRILLGRLEGHITEAEFEEFYGTIPLYMAKLNPQSAIADFSRVSRFDVRKEKLRGMAYAPPAIRDPNLPRVLVAPALPLYGLARMFQMLGEETRPTLTIARSLEEAYEELHVKNPRFEPLGPLELE